MATDEQNVFITGSSLADWSTEATQSQIASSLKQIQADGNAMIRFLHHIANGTKITSNELKKAVNSIKQSSGNDKVADKKELAQGNRIVSSQQKIASSTLASLSAMTGIGESILDSEQKQRKRDNIRNALLSKGFSADAASRGADRKMQGDLLKRIGEKMVTMAVGIKGLMDLATGAVEQGFAERFAMVAEMRQAGLLRATEKAEDGFISMAKTISNTNFTFGEATEFTKRFAKAVGVNGVKSALTFANTVASGEVENGMNYMRKYALEFGQVSNIAGEYIDSLRIGGQLRGMDDRSMRAGMDDFMSNVEMTSNVLKISMEDAADLMKKALGPDSVALLATLPKQQREAIEKGFLSVNAQGNPMSETLAKRLAAGSQGAFLQTAEYQEMAGTAPGREILNFVEQMAQQLENGDTESFQAALAEGFPALADRLTQMATQGGIRVQLLSDPQLASMVGQIIEAAQTYGDAAKGTRQIIGKEDKSFMENLIQLREAAVLNETAMNNHMDTFADILLKMVAVHRDIARSGALMLEDYKGTIGFATGASAWFKQVKGAGLTFLMDLATSEDPSKHPAGGVLSLLEIQGQPGYGGRDFNKKNDELIDTRQDQIQEIYDRLEKNADGLSQNNQIVELRHLSGEIGILGSEIVKYAASARNTEGKEWNETMWLENFESAAALQAAILKLVNKLDN
jgi:hypothetical protein